MQCDLELTDFNVDGFELVVIDASQENELAVVCVGLVADQKVGFRKDTGRLNLHRSSVVS